MTPPALALLVLGLASGAWLLARARPLDLGALGAARSASIIIPARDEEASLPHLLASLAAARSAAREVIVVDDGSTDRTRALAEATGVTVVVATPPPEGWLGKPWACELGAEIATGEVLVFLDADTRLAPDALDRLLTTHARHPDGLLSVQPFHDVPSAVEQLSAVPNLVSLLASGAFTPRGSGATAVAYGPCLVTSASAYAAVGGHGSVAGEVIEDVHLARRYRDAGRPVHARAGRGAVRFRMYPDGGRALVEGWTKNLAGGVGLAPVGPTLGAVAWVAAGMAVIAASAVALAAGDGDAAPALGAAWGLYSVHLGWMLRRVGSFRPWVWLVFPVVLLAFVALFLRSAWARSVRRSVRWRGREVAVRRA